MLSEEARYRLLLDAITDYAVYMLDRDGNVASWNAGAERAKGYKAHEIIGRHFSTFYTPPDLATDLPARALRTAAGEGRFEGEGWRIRKDGSRFWANVVIDPVRTAEGHLIGFAKITRDLTERRESQLALARSQEQFKILVQGVTDYAIYMLDPQGHVSSWNSGAEKIKGYRPDEIIGAHFSQFYEDEDRRRSEPQTTLETALRDGRSDREGWRIRKDGSRFWAHVVVEAIRDEAGTLIGFAKITRDLTERRRMQIQLDQARENLFQAQKIEAMGQLTGGIAHDFNNLLMIVLGSLELARKRLPDDPKLKTLIDNAVTGAQRGASLTQRMLAYARRQDLNSAPVDLAELTQGMTDLLHNSVGAGMRIQIDIPPGLPQIMTDANQLETALINLVVNARDAMPDGGLIVIGAHEEERIAPPGTNPPSGRYVCLTVTDTGEGMDPETLKRAADPFFTTKGVGKGTGLGLSMVHGLAEQSGGQMRLESALGQGTTVSLCLPVIAEAPATAAPRDANPTQEARPAQGLTVLAVDDDVLVLMNTTALLEELGHTVIEATSAAAALAVLESGRDVDLLVTDHAMPNMTGAQLIGLVNERWPDLPVIMATGYAELPPGTSASLVRLSKPFSEIELGQAVARALGRTG